MKPPVPAKGKPTGPRPEPAAPRREPPPSGPTHNVTVRYYCSMKPWRVYTLVVGLARPSRPQPAGTSTAPLVVRPVIPGAQVAPAELKLDPSRPGAQVTFHVTPLARGRLSGARVEVVHQGQTVQEIRLRMKGVRQLWTWVLLFLTFAIPGFLLYATK